MKKALRALLVYGAGLAAGTAFFGGLAYASTGVREILAHYANIRLDVAGKVIPTRAEPFIFNHNVYVPVSAIGQSLGAKVQWNGKKKQVDISLSRALPLKTGLLEYYGLPVYSGTHTATYNGKQYVAALALATVAGKPYYFDSAKDTVYIGSGPGSGMPIQAFYDVRDYGDYASGANGAGGPMYGWTDGAPRIAGVLYPNANSLVWASQSQNSQVPGVTYNLGGNYGQLTGAFGLDDASDGKEQVQLTISGDGQQLYQSPWMGKGQPAAPVSVDVKGVKLLTVSFAVKDLATGQVYSMGQTVPGNLAADIDFADVNLHV